ncbi:Transposase, Ptta/En/Spm, plant [Corchorus olitorius]|uniref:Transposase, Ptta/En/Spm, plant n=1 Tax=Corchorus olitorius TaxID=93759 RepID=A0A1R3G9Q4_9ROSI|nr:Transposase, Ptta/En/Spm, plant [Corchorus olitorius]
MAVCNTKARRIVEARWQEKEVATYQAEEMEATSAVQVLVGTLELRDPNGINLFVDFSGFQVTMTEHNHQVYENDTKEYDGSTNEEENEDNNDDYEDDDGIGWLKYFMRRLNVSQAGDNGGGDSTASPPTTPPTPNPPVPPVGYPTQDSPTVDPPTQPPVPSNTQPPSPSNTPPPILRMSAKTVHAKMKAIITGHFNGPWTSYKKFPTFDCDRFWQLFEGAYTWDEQYAGEIKSIFEKKASDWLKGALYRVRNKKICLAWIKEEHWPKMKDEWDGEKFKKVSRINKANRVADTLASSIVYTGGSIPTSIHRKRLAEVLHKQPTMKEVFEITYKKKNGDWAGEKAHQVTQLEGLRGVVTFGAGDLARVLEQMSQPSTQGHVSREEYNTLLDLVQQLIAAMRQHGIGVSVQGDPHVADP